MTASDPAATTTDKVRAHYDRDDLTERLRVALLAFGDESQTLTPEQLGPLDQFHTRGLAATADLARSTGISESDLVLDVGSGLGGPARYIAQTYGCEVIGVDLSPSFTQASRYLTARTGQSDKVTFETANALDLPFTPQRFDLVMLQHVAMNIANRDALYTEIRRVLKTGGRFATFDVVKVSGEPHYPVPWARTPDTSFILDADETRAAIEAAGFRTRVWQDDTAAATAWFEKIRAGGAPAGPNLGLVLGPDFPGITGNLGRSLSEGCVGILAAVFEAI